MLAWWSRAHDASPPAEWCGTTSWATPACVIYVSWEVPGLPGFGEGCTVCLPAQSQLESWAWCPPPTPQMATVRPAGTCRRRLRPALVYVLSSSSHLGALYLCSELAWPVPRSRRQKGPSQFNLRTFDPPVLAERWRGCHTSTSVEQHRSLGQELAHDSRPGHR